MVVVNTTKPNAHALQPTHNQNKQIRTIATYTFTVLGENLFILRFLKLLEPLTNSQSVSQWM